MPKKKKKRFDVLAKEALRKWPSWTTKLWPVSREGGSWLRAQPIDGSATGPRLSKAGADTFKTQPDGLWVFIANDEFADCIAIEACSARQNFWDKRSRYMPSTSAVVLQCPSTWLTSKVNRGRGQKPRWKLASGFQSAPVTDLRLPVRFLRVLYFLENGLYSKWREVGVPEAHEFVASYSSIKSYNSEKMQVFLRRMSLVQHFYTK